MEKEPRSTMNEEAARSVINEAERSVINEAERSAMRVGEVSVQASWSPPIPFREPELVPVKNVKGFDLKAGVTIGNDDGRMKGSKKTKQKLLVQQLMNTKASFFRPYISDSRAARKDIERGRRYTTSNGEGHRTVEAIEAQVVPLCNNIGTGGLFCGLNNGELKNGGLNLGAGKLGAVGGVLNLGEGFSVTAQLNGVPNLPGANNVPTVSGSLVGTSGSSLLNVKIGGGKVGPLLPGAGVKMTSNDLVSRNDEANIKGFERDHTEAEAPKARMPIANIMIQPISVDAEAALAPHDLHREPATAATFGRHIGVYRSQSSCSHQPQSSPKKLPKETPEFGYKGPLQNHQKEETRTQTTALPPLPIGLNLGLSQIPTPRTRENSPDQQNSAENRPGHQQAVIGSQQDDPSSRLTETTTTEILSPLQKTTEILSPLQHPNTVQSITLQEATTGCNVVSNGSPPPKQISTSIPLSPLQPATIISGNRMISVEIPLSLEKESTVSTQSPQVSPNQISSRSETITLESPEKQVSNSPSQEKPMLCPWPAARPEKRVASSSPEKPNAISDFPRTTSTEIPRWQPPDRPITPLSGVALQKAAVKPSTEVPPVAGNAAKSIAKPLISNGVSLLSPERGNNGFILLSPDRKPVISSMKVPPSMMFENPMRNGVSFHSSEKRQPLASSIDDPNNVLLSFPEKPMNNEDARRAMESIVQDDRNVENQPEQNSPSANKNVENQSFAIQSLPSPRIQSPVSYLRQLENARSATIESRIGSVARDGVLSAVVPTIGFTNPFNSRMGNKNPFNTRQAENNSVSDYSLNEVKLSSESQRLLEECLYNLVSLKGVFEKVPQKSEEINSFLIAIEKLKRMMMTGYYNRTTDSSMNALPHQNVVVNVVSINELLQTLDTISNTLKGCIKAFDVFQSHVEKSASDTQSLIIDMTTMKESLTIKLAELETKISTIKNEIETKISTIKNEIRNDIEKEMKLHLENLVQVQMKTGVESHMKNEVESQVQTQINKQVECEFQKRLEELEKKVIKHVEEEIGREIGKKEDARKEPYEKETPLEKQVEKDLDRKWKESEKHIGCEIENVTKKFTQKLELNESTLTKRIQELENRFEEKWKRIEERTGTPAHSPDMIDNRIPDTIVPNDA